MKQSILIILTLFALSCEDSEVGIINDPDLAHKFILEQTKQELIDFSFHLDSLCSYTDYLNDFICNNHYIYDTEMDKHHELKIKTLESLWPLLDKLNTLHGLVNEKILSNHIQRYYAYNHYITEHINLNFNL